MVRKYDILTINKKEPILHYVFNLRAQIDLLDM